MIVAITGGTGFIGTRLALHFLARGDSVRLLSRSLNAKKGLPDGINFHQGDLTNDTADLYSFVKGADVLFHCAGEINNPTRMHALHVAGTQRLIAAASQSIGHWVQLSSTGAYGRVMKGVVTEESPLNPNNQYEITKSESDRLVTAATDRGLFTSTILCPSNVFGSTMPNQSLFKMISMISRGLFFFIGDVGASANYIHVDNVVHGLVCCATVAEAKGKTYIISDNRPLEEFVAVIAAALCKPVPRLRFPEMPVRLAVKCFEKLPGFPLTSARIDALTKRVVYSTRLIQQELNYSNPVQMEDALRQLVLAWKYKQ